MLAEKVEDHADFIAARDIGFVFFQGYFLRRPEMITTRDVPANRLNYLRMLQAVSQPELDVPETREADQDRSFHLLPAIALHEFGQVRIQQRNSFRPSRPLDSRRTRSAALGPADRHRGRWTGQDQRSRTLRPGPRPLRRVACAVLASHGESDLFLLGLLSMLDVMLEMPMSEILEKIPLDAETKAVLRESPVCCVPSTN